MKLLLDSNVLLWSLSDRSRLTPRVRRLLDEEPDVQVSLASLWELSIKIAKGKLAVPNSTIQSLLDELDAAAIPLLAITPAHILRAEKLPHLHRDPFDRLIIAQALEEELTLLSSDALFSAYGVPVIWH